MKKVIITHFKIKNMLFGISILQRTTYVQYNKFITSRAAVIYFDVLENSPQINLLMQIFANFLSHIVHMFANYLR
jgi:hypothetical protein